MQLVKSTTKIFYKLFQQNTSNTGHMKTHGFLYRKAMLRFLYAVQNNAASHQTETSFLFITSIIFIVAKINYQKSKFHMFKV